MERCRRVVVVSLFALSACHSVANGDMPAGGSSKKPSAASGTGGARSASVEGDASVGTGSGGRASTSNGTDAGSNRNDAGNAGQPKDAAVARDASTGNGKGTGDAGTTLPTPGMDAGTVVPNDGGIPLDALAGMLGMGSCCAAHDNPGCSNADLQVCVCEKLPSCCTDSWSEACTLIVKQKYCQPGVQDCVCNQWMEPTCCSDDWTQFCDQVAISKCGAQSGCL